MSCKMRTSSRVHTKETKKEKLKVKTLSSLFVLEHLKAPPLRSPASLTSHTLRHIHTPPAAAMMVGAFLSYSLHLHHLHLQFSDASSNNKHRSSLYSDRPFWYFCVSPQQEGLDDGPDFLSEEDRGVSFFFFSDFYPLSVLLLFVVCVCSRVKDVCITAGVTVAQYVCVSYLSPSVHFLLTNLTHTNPCMHNESLVGWQCQKLGQEATNHIMPLTIN